ncbi:hypothetical protein [Arenimonas sp. MALMAid1274]|uniref:hypothetical protein n=1 Tax=Arenimonas sp. MALMAid1274 TaxID=3411630 RepID=UPI003B9ED9A2
MSARTVEMAAPFGWLMKSLDVGRRNPKALFGALLLMVVVVFAMTAMQMVAQAIVGPSLMALGVVYVVVMLFSAVVMPPITGGVFRVIDATHRGAPARATDVFSMFRQPGAARQVILVSLLFTAFYLVCAAALSFTAVGQFYKEYFAIAMAVPPGGQPDMDAIKALLLRAPNGLLPTTLLMMLVALVWTHAYMLSLAGVALRGGDVLPSAAAGTVAALKNFLPLLGFVIVAAIVGFIVVLLLAIVLALVMVVLSLVSPVLATVVMVPAMVLMMLALYAVMFGFYYHAWCDIFGETSDAVPPAPEAVAL